MIVTRLDEPSAEEKPADSVTDHAPKFPPKHRLALGSLAVLVLMLPFVLFGALAPTRWFPSAAPAPQPDTPTTLGSSSALYDPANLTDVDTTSWSWKYIQQIVPIGIIPPRTSTTFDPQGKVLRVDMAEFLTRTYEILTKTTISASSNPFTDIAHLTPEQQEAIAKAYTVKITAGTSATTFSPNTEVNRAQMATFLSNLYKAITGQYAPEVSIPFTDIWNDDITWAQKPIARIYGLKITAGISPTEFGPYQTTTREQMAAFIFNFMRLFGPSANDPLFKTSLSSLRSVTFYSVGMDEPSQYYTLLSAYLNSLKQTGFHAVWLVSPWYMLNPQPLASPPVYNEAEFTALRQTLQRLKENNMKAILNLNYLGPNWSPEGIDSCTWITNPTSYAAFETYVKEFLTRISDYSDSVYILFSTENSEPCNLDPHGDAKKHAALLRPTLGSLPSRLPPNLRSKFKIGYHDYSLISLGWAGGESPLALPLSYDFLSISLYDNEARTDAQIAQELTTRLTRFQSLYPFTPIIVGEVGASSCSNKNSSEETQARAFSAFISSAQSKNLGFNIWGWWDASCSDKNAGLGLMKETHSADGEFQYGYKQAKYAIETILNPSPSPTASPTPTSRPLPVCGDGICQSVSCTALNCPPPEDNQNCPQDCDSTAPSPSSAPASFGGLSSPKITPTSSPLPTIQPQTKTTQAPPTPTPEAAPNPTPLPSDSPVSGPVWQQVINTILNFLRL